MNCARNKCIFFVNWYVAEELRANLNFAYFAAMYMMNKLIHYSFYPIFFWGPIHIYLGPLIDLRLWGCKVFPRSPSLHGVKPDINVAISHCSELSQQMKNIESQMFSWFIWNTILAWNKTKKLLDIPLYYPERCTSKNRSRCSRCYLSP